MNRKKALRIAKQIQDECKNNPYCIKCPFRKISEGGDYEGCLFDITPEDLDIKDEDIN